MKKLKSAVIFSTLLISLSASSQNVAQPRQYSPTETLTIQKGIIDNFKYQLFRFTTALEEKDQGSVDAMKPVLMDAIQAEIDRLQKAASTEAADAAVRKRFEAQKKLQKALVEARFSTNLNSFEKSMKDKTLLDDFVKNMEEGYHSLEQKLSGQ